MNQLFKLAAFLLIFPFGKVSAIQPLDSIPKPRKYQKQFSILFEAGPMIPRGTDWSDVIKDDLKYKALDMRLGFRKIQPKVYNMVYRYPTFGFGFYTATFKNPYIGKPNAVYLFADIPFPKSFQNNKLTFSYLAAMGVSFNFKPYDPEYNPINQFIGSYQNGYVHVSFNMRYQLFQDLSLESAIGFKHFSNGSLKKPNAGLNFIPFSIGAKFNLNQSDLGFSEYKETPKFVPNGQINIWVSAGGKNYQKGENVYLKSVVGVNYLRQWNYKYRMGLGMDLFYSSGTAIRYPSKSVSIGDQISVALVGSWEWVLTKNIYVPIAFGTYLHRNVHNEEIKWFYKRIGARYRFDNHFFAGVTLKAHGFKADFFEWTLGYSIFNDKNKY
ncbi:Lipid A 3-O-deacylase (PagL) [Aquiflexum balticum DSM 16537]|uniref:Lipid A 3-O-deacylase (PagL) n=1 Tax=Aquiflexum balticum DSM 16537 TaxID=758820 RepID=A0A1W2H755_9BACT|nr:acyloxyacyl hydrolase [Aquiflexum balticum]SMD44689.1 Lipid A 3-O-deacylase (PagL) [Aquiflexum balticum DSM 16537]